MGEGTFFQTDLTRELPPSRFTRLGSVPSELYDGITRNDLGGSKEWGIEQRSGVRWPTVTVSGPLGKCGARR